MKSIEVNDDFIKEISNEFKENMEKVLELKNKPVIYRPHRMGGCVVDSLEEKKIFNNEKKMLEYIIETYARGYYTINDLVIANEEVNDERIGWFKCHYVCIKRFGEEVFDHPQCIGYCAYEWKND